MFNIIWGKEGALRSNLACFRLNYRSLARRRLPLKRKNDAYSVGLTQIVEMESEILAKHTQRAPDFRLRLKFRLTNPGGVQRQLLSLV